MTYDIQVPYIYAEVEAEPFGTPLSHSASLHTTSLHHYLGIDPMWPFSTAAESSLPLSNVLVPGSSRPSTINEPQQQPQTQKAEKIKPCCACPDTKRVRDDCFLRYGPPDESSESAIKCADLIVAHRACMAQYGFQV